MCVIIYFLTKLKHFELAEEMKFNVCNFAKNDYRAICFSKHFKGYDLSF